jgi:hypothetical protein
VANFSCVKYGNNKTFSHKATKGGDMQVGDLVRIKKAWRSMYEGYEDAVGLVVYADRGYGGERPVGFRRIRILHGDIQGQIYSVFSEEVLEVVCSK